MLWPPPDQDELNKLCDDVTMVAIGSYNLRLYVAKGAIDIQTAFSLVPEPEATNAVAQQFPLKHADPLRQLLDQTITRLQISEGGILRAAFSNGLVLTAYGDPRFESYAISIGADTYFL